MPELWDTQRYFIFLLYFVLALCEGQNEIQNN